MSDASTSTPWADNGANLDLAVELYNSANVLLASANPTGLAANLTVSSLAPDTYYLKLDGVGFGTPTISPPTGYSDYASIGSYLISGTISGGDTAPQISLSLGPNFSVNEDGITTLVWTFSRSGDTSAPLTVNATLAGTAANGSDYSLTGWTAGTISFLAGQATATVSADPTADTSQEADETLSLQIGSGSGYTIATTSAVVGTITNDDLPLVSLTVSPASVTEDGAPNLLYTFSRSYASADALVVSYTLAGTATLGSDYTGPSTSGVVKTITISANATSATLTVNPTADTEIEADETVGLTLVPGFGYSVATAAAVVGTIVNDDLPVVTLAVNPATAAEAGADTLLFSFSRSGSTTKALTIAYAIGGTATSGVDYAPISGSVTFAAGSSTTTLSIDPLSDNLVESNETVVLTLQAGSDYLVGTPAAVTGTILNSDPPQITLALSPAQVRENGLDGGLLYTFSRSTATADALTVGYTVAGTASQGVDYDGIPAANTITFQPNALTATLLLTPLTDTLPEGNESVEITLAPGSGYTVGTPDPVVGILLNVDLPLITVALESSTVAEDAAMPLVWTFSRSGPVETGLSVSILLGGSAIAGSDYAPVGGSVTFLPGEATTSLAITPIADTTFEPDETLDLTLLAGSAYTVGTLTPLTGTLLNDDVPQVSLAVAPAAVNENSGLALLYTFSRTGDISAPLTVSYDVGGTASLGSDYNGIPTVGTPKSLTIAAGAASATLSVTPVGDLTVESNETVVLTLQAGSGYTVASSAPVVGTILNDDRPTVTLTLAPSTVTESGSDNLVYTFTRSVATADPLTVSYSLGGTASPGNDYSGLASGIGTRTVTIAAGSGSSQVVVDPIDDTTIESHETVVLTLLSNSAYTVGTTSPITGTISNDDSNPPPTSGADTLTFTPSQDTLTGLGGADIFQLIDLKNSLFVSGSTVDKVTTFVTSEDVFDSPFRSTVITPKDAGSVSSLTASAIANRLTNNRFAANGAATFSFGSGSSLRTFLAINDATGSFQAANDAIIEITGYSGSLSNLRVT